MPPIRSRALCFKQSERDGSKKLHRISEIVLENRARSQDPVVWEQCLVDHYGRKWGVHKSHARWDIVNFLMGQEDQCFDITLQMVQTTFGKN